MWNFDPGHGKTGYDGLVRVVKEKAVMPHWDGNSAMRTPLRGLIALIRVHEWGKGGWWIRSPASLAAPGRRDGIGLEESL